jgi:hypothetical protein
MAAARARRGGGGLSLCLASAGVVKMPSITAFTFAWTGANVTIMRGFEP